MRVSLPLPSSREVGAGGAPGICTPLWSVGHVLNKVFGACVAASLMHKGFRSQQSRKVSSYTRLPGSSFPVP